MGHELKRAQHPRPLPVPVGREVVCASDEAVLDVSVELVARGVCPLTWRSASGEPADKGAVRLRLDRRDAAATASIAYFESGTARQLAAALVRAADLIDEIEIPTSSH